MAGARGLHAREDDEGKDELVPDARAQESHVPEVAAGAVLRTPHAC